MWKKSVASTPRAWALRNADHSLRAGARRGAGLSRDCAHYPADGRDPDAVPEPAQLAVNALATPARILGAEADDQVAQFLGDRRPAQRLRLRPPSCHHALVPGQQRAWGDDPVLTQRPGQRPGRCGEHSPVRPVRFRRRQLAAQHRHLLPEHEDLDVLRRRRPGQQHQPGEYPTGEQVGHANDPKEAIEPRAATATDQPSTAIPRKYEMADQSHRRLSRLLRALIA